jgi:NADH-quinone oxidoreductase subunit N
VSIETVYSLLPEAVLVLVASLIYVVGVFVRARRVWGWVAVGAIALAAIFLAAQGFQDGPRNAEIGDGGRQPLVAAALRDGELQPVAAGDAESPPRSVGATNVANSPLALDADGRIDPLGQYVRWLSLVVGLALVLLAARPDDDVQEPEFIGTLLLAVAGSMIVATTRDLVLLFLGIELISIPTYVLLYLGRRDAASPEAAAKYFFLSILSSALTLYGFSFLYGIGRSTDLAALQAVLTDPATAASGLAPLGAVALVLIFAGIGFKITAVPFHFYAPDVYQATTNGNAGVLAVLPKIAGFVALVRIVAVAMPGLEAYGWRIALVLAVLTMTVGNVLGLWQDNIRRLMAYSSVAHAGYMLIGLAVGLAAVRPSSGQSATFDGIGAVLLYLAVYALATAGTFAALAYLGGEGRQVDGVDELAGLARSHPMTALFMAVFMFSLAGIPPLAGFWGKFTIFGSALNLGDDTGVANVRMWFIALAVIGVLNAAIAAGYYLRIVAVIYFRSPLAVPRGAGGVGAAIAAGMCAMLVILIGVFPGPLVDLSTEAAVTARSSPPAALTGAAETADAGDVESRANDRAETQRRPPSLPLNGGRGLRANVVHHAVHTLDLVDDAGGDARQQVVR